MSDTLRIGIAGLGTVGVGVTAMLRDNARLIEQRCGKRLLPVAVSARDKTRDRGISLEGLRWHDRPEALAQDAEIDIILELMGGDEGAARQLVEAALKAGKPVVTANKALIAKHGLALSKLAEANGAVLAFEAAVAGGIPILAAMQGGLAANRFTRITGILNGTCNYILSRMSEEGDSFDAVLQDAQALGYAEADPSFDIDGVDTAHKLAILTSLAFGTAPSFDAISIEGIRQVTAEDMESAAELGYAVKLLGIASQDESGIIQRVHPALVAKESSLGSVHGVFNAVQVESDFAGRMFFEGRGAGAGPTASAVLADVMDIARGVTYHPFTLEANRLQSPPNAGMENLHSAHYLRLQVIDKPGVLAEVTDIFREAGISLRSFLQRESAPAEPVTLVLTTHPTGEAAMTTALAAITCLTSVTQPPYRIRIES